MEFSRGKKGTLLRERVWTGLGTAVALALAGCGGGGQSNGGSAAVTVARASADPTVLQTANPAAAQVTITWGVPPGIPPSRIVEYQILRSNAVIGVAQPGVFTFTDRAAHPEHFVHRWPATDGGLMYVQGVHSPPVAGNAFLYGVRALYRGNDGRHRFTPLPDSGLATPIARPGVNGPTTDQNLTRVQVDFQTVQGADAYIFEFSPSADFAGKVSRGPFSVVPTPNVTSRSEVFDIAGEFSDVPEGSLIHVRVGARNHADAPGPVSSDVANGGDFIYSVQNRAFRKSGSPPAPP